MNMKGVNKALTTVKSVAKKSTKVVGALLPIASVVANGLDAHTINPGNPARALEEFISRYDGVNRDTGEWQFSRFMKGTGSLIGTGIAGFIINEFS